MNGKKYVLITILLLAIGFASVSTVLYINGTASIEGDLANFVENIVFDEDSIKTSTGSYALVSNSGRTLNFTTGELNTIGASANLNFKIKNYSQYNAKLGSPAINCYFVDDFVEDTNASKKSINNDYIRITTGINLNNAVINAGGGLSEESNISVEQIKSYAGDIKGNTTMEVKFQCTINVIAEDSITASIDKTNKKINLYNMMKNNSSSTIIDYSSLSNYSNGLTNGIYTTMNTQDNSPVYYYRGDIKNNNVLFDNMCWKIVRTTETGGVKMIYNGVPKKNYSLVKSLTKEDYTIIEDESDLDQFDYNDNINTWSVNTDDSSFFILNISPGNNIGIKYDLKKDDEFEIYQYFPETMDTNTIFYSDKKSNGIIDVSNYYNKEIIIYYRGESGEFEIGDFSFSVVEQTGTYTISCDNTGILSGLETIDFYDVGPYIQGNYEFDNAMVGYMYGEKKSDNYKDTHTNTYDSPAKELIESWYKNEIEDKGYTKYIEDTIYCNNRNIFFEEDDDINLLGYNNNSTTYAGGNFEDFYYGIQIPSLKCRNTTGFVSENNDSFTVKSSSSVYNPNLNGNKKLNYPVGLLTVDEAAMAGINGNYESNVNNYLYIGYYWWTMTPNRINRYVVAMNSIYDSISTDNQDFGGGYGLIRPVISIKSGVLFNGSGTIFNPYKLIES